MINDPSENGKIVIGRHGKKYDIRSAEEQEKNPVKFGNFYDKNFVYITEESADYLRGQGRTILGNEDIEFSLLITSDFIRAKQTGLYFLEGGKGLKERTIILQDENLGARNGYDWNHQALPKYSTEKEKADGFIKKLFEGFYFKSEDPKIPNMALNSFDFISSIINGIGILNVNYKGKKQLFTHFTHAPNVDTLAMLVLDCLEIEPKNRIVKVNDRYKGHVAMGEMFTGNLCDMDSNNPSIELAIKKVVKGFKLSDLKRIQKQTYDYSKL